MHRSLLWHKVVVVLATEVSAEHASKMVPSLWRIQSELMLHLNKAFNILPTPLKTYTNHMKLMVYWFIVSFKGVLCKQEVEEKFEILTQIFFFFIVSFQQLLPMLNERQPGVIFLVSRTHKTRILLKSKSHTAKYLNSLPDLHKL